MTVLSRAEEHRSNRRFVLNSILLIAVNLFMRTVGVSFSVYQSSVAGAEVMGLHSLLLGVYGLFITLGCGSIHLGTTRLTAAALGRSDGSGVRAVVRKCIRYAVVCGCGAAVLLFLSARWFGTVWLGDERVVSSLRVLSLSLLPMALSSCLSGYFTGVRRVALSSAAGILAQLSRLGFGVMLLNRWAGCGAERLCLAVVLGSVLSEWLGLCLSVPLFLFDLHRHFPADNTNGDIGAGDTPLLKQLTKITVPVTAAACLRSGLVTIQHSLIPRGLKASGASWASSLASYGVLHGVVLPVVLFPSAFISSFSGLLVPEVAEADAAGDRVRVAVISQRVLWFGLVFSFGTAGIMSCFSYEIGHLICRSAEAGQYIRMLAPLIPIMYIDSSVDAVLKGMGQQLYSMLVNIADALTSVILVWVLVPRMGLDGYIISVYVTETLNTTLSLARMLPVSGVRVFLLQMVAEPLVAVIGACALLRLWSDVYLIGCSTVAVLALLITLGVLLYLVLLTFLYRSDQRIRTFLKVYAPVGIPKGG